MSGIDLTSAQWVKSTYSGNGGNCVEIAPGFSGVLPVRDSKDPDGGALIFPNASWSAFVAEVQAGGFGVG